MTNLLRELFRRRERLPANWQRLSYTPVPWYVAAARGLLPIMGGGATEQRADVGGVFLVTGVTVDPVSQTAVTAATLAVTIAGILTTDVVVALPPVTLEAGIVVQGVTVTAVNSVNVRTTNPSAGTIDPASAATWQFLVFRR